MALTTALATGGTVPSATSVGGASASLAVAAASAETSAAEPATSDTVPSATSIRGAVGARESSAGAVSSDAATEAAPSTGGTAAPAASTAREARACVSSWVRWRNLRREGGVHPPLRSRYRVSAGGPLLQRQLVAA